MLVLKMPTSCPELKHGIMQSPSRITQNPHRRFERKGPSPSGAGDPGITALYAFRGASGRWLLM
jgi:hypothetical protein